jgi:hypothetical protein
MASDLAEVERRLRRIYESIEAGSGLNLHEVAPRLRELRAQQDTLKLGIEQLDADPGPQINIGSSDVTMAARVFRDVLVTAESAAKVREFLGHIMKRVVLGDGEVTLEYLPERIVNAQLGGSRCEVRWLPSKASKDTRHPAPHIRCLGYYYEYSLWRPSA